MTHQKRISLFIGFCVFLGAILSPPSHASVLYRQATPKQGDEASPTVLALQWVVYRQEEVSRPILEAHEAEQVLAEVNRIWGGCGIQFQLERYDAVIPKDFGLHYHPAESSELDLIRRAWVNPKQLLMVATGSWDRSGSLGGSFANAWTSLPGEIPYGVVLEAPVAEYSNLIAHELGHYLGLLHEGDSENLMHPVIHGFSRQLDPQQCAEAHHAISVFWRSMIRNELGRIEKLR
jgi:hypothetical protein